MFASKSRASRACGNLIALFAVLGCSATDETKEIRASAARDLEKTMTFLGDEDDGCTGGILHFSKVTAVVTVKNKDGEWKEVPHYAEDGKYLDVDVQLEADGWWRWRCNGKPEEGERARGREEFRDRVNRLRVWHHKGGEIIWECFEVK